MAQSPLEAVSPTEIGGYLKNWDALSSMIVRGRSFSGGERHCAFINTGGTRFADASAALGFDLVDDGRALAQCDWDGDGDLDLWTTNRTAPRVKFLRNDISDPKGQNDWVSFSLEGTKCNRDAIGARLEITVAGKTLTRSLSAGEGFMAQSSKRVFFGLGPDAGDASLAVHWPASAEPERFTAIAPGAAYRIVQGSGTAEPLPKRTPPTGEALAVKPRATTEQARVLLSYRTPAPSLNYVDFAGELQRFEPGKRGHATLINLWASWCAPCVAELADFKTHHAALAEKGVHVLAITAEAVRSDGQKPDLTAAKALVADESYPFEIGASDANSLRLLTVLHNAVFTRERPLPLPSSFLIDRHGNLAAIYKGPVSATQILDDANMLEAPRDLVVEAAFPFKSSDGLDLFRIGPLDFAQAYQLGGYLDEARIEAQNAIDAAGSDGAALAKAWYYTATLEQSRRRWAAAAEAYQKVIEIVPGNPLLKVPLGVVLSQDGQHDAADKAFAEASAAMPDDAKLHDALGKAHLQIGRHEVAVRYFEKAVELDPENLTYLFDLALGHESAGAPAAAIQQYEAALAKHPDSLDAKNNLAWILATSPDETVRDGARALTLAKAVNDATNNANPATLDTLAAAHAENGDFEAAATIIESAIPLARARGQSAVAASLREKHLLYLSGDAYRSDKESK